MFLHNQDCLQDTLKGTFFFLVTRRNLYFGYYKLLLVVSPYYRSSLGPNLGLDTYVDATADHWTDAQYAVWNSIAFNAEIHGQTSSSSDALPVCHLAIAQAFI